MPALDDGVAAHKSKSVLGTLVDLLQRSVSAKEAILGPNHLSTAEAKSNLGVVAAFRGHFNDASRLLEHALGSHEAALGGVHPGIAVSANNLAMCHRIDPHADPRHARPRMDSALALRNADANFYQLRGLSPADTSNAMLRAGAALWASNSPREAAALFAAAARLRIPNQDIDANLQGGVYREFADGDGNGAVAGDNLAQILSNEAMNDQSVVGPLARALAAQGAALRDAGRFGDARLVLTRVLKLRTAAFGPSHACTGAACAALGSVLIEVGDVEGGERQLRRSIDILDATLAGQGVPQISVLSSSQQKPSSTGHGVAATSHTVSSRSRVLAGVCAHLAGLLCSQGRVDEAVPVWQRCVTLRSSALGEGHPATVAANQALAAALEECGRSTDAMVTSAGTNAAFWRSLVTSGSITDRSSVAGIDMSMNDAGPGIVRALRDLGRLIEGIETEARRRRAMGAKIEQNDNTNHAEAEEGSAPLPDGSGENHGDAGTAPASRRGGLSSIANDGVVMFLNMALKSLDSAALSNRTNQRVMAQLLARVVRNEVWWHEWKEPVRPTSASNDPASMNAAASQHEPGSSTFKGVSAGSALRPETAGRVRPTPRRPQTALRRPGSAAPSSTSSKRVRWGGGDGANGDDVNDNLMDSELNNDAEDRLGETPFTVDWSFESARKRLLTIQDGLGLGAWSEEDTLVDDEDHVDVCLSTLCDVDSIWATVPAPKPKDAAKAAAMGFDGHGVDSPRSRPIAADGPPTSAGTLGSNRDALAGSPTRIGSRPRWAAVGGGVSAAPAPPTAMVDHGNESGGVGDAESIAASDASSAQWALGDRLGDGFDTPGPSRPVSAVARPTSQQSQRNHRKPPPGAAAARPDLDWQPHRRSGGGSGNIQISGQRPTSAFMMHGSSDYAYYEGSIVDDDDNDSIDDALSDARTALPPSVHDQLQRIARGIVLGPTPTYYGSRPTSGVYRGANNGGRTQGNNNVMMASEEIPIAEPGALGAADAFGQLRNRLAKYAKYRAVPSVRDRVKRTAQAATSRPGSSVARHHSSARFGYGGYGGALDDVDDDFVQEDYGGDDDEATDRALEAATVTVVGSSGAANGLAGGKPPTSSRAAHPSRSAARNRSGNNVATTRPSTAVMRPGTATSAQGSRLPPHHRPMQRPDSALTMTSVASTDVSTSVPQSAYQRARAQLTMHYTTKQYVRPPSGRKHVTKPYRPSSAKVLESHGYTGTANALSSYANHATSTRATAESVARMAPTAGIYKPSASAAHPSLAVPGATAPGTRQLIGGKFGSTAVAVAVAAAAAAAAGVRPSSTASTASTASSTSSQGGPGGSSGLGTGPSPSPGRVRPRSSLGISYHRARNAAEVYQYKGPRPSSSKRARSGVTLDPSQSSAHHGSPRHGSHGAARPFTAMVGGRDHADTAEGRREQQQLSYWRKYSPATRNAIDSYKQLFKAAGRLEGSAEESLVISELTKSARYSTVRTHRSENYQPRKTKEEEEDERRDATGCFTDRSHGDGDDGDDDGEASAYGPQDRDTIPKMLGGKGSKANQGGSRYHVNRSMYVMKMLGLDAKTGEPSNEVASQAQGVPNPNFDSGVFPNYNAVT